MLTFIDTQVMESIDVFEAIANDYNEDASETSMDFFCRIRLVLLSFAEFFAPIAFLCMVSARAML